MIRALLWATGVAWLPLVATDYGYGFTQVLSIAWSVMSEFVVEGLRRQVFRWLVLGSSTCISALQILRRCWRNTGRQVILRGMDEAPLSARFPSLALLQLIETVGNVLGCPIGFVPGWGFMDGSR